MTIIDIKPMILKLAEGAPPPKSLCWLVHIDKGEWIDADYCPDCAVTLVAWLTTGKGEPPDIDDLGDHPTGWLGSKSNDVWFVDTRGDYESDGIESCELCGYRLQASLLISGVQSEIEHFELHGINSTTDWRDFYTVLEGIDHVEADWFPSYWMAAREQDLHRDLYYRALTLAEKHVPEVMK